MSEELYWFEEVPEERRYWFLAPYGQSLSQEADQEDAEFPPDLRSELENIRDERQARVFGMTIEQYLEKKKDASRRLKRMAEVGFGPLALSDPGWPETPKGVHRQGNEYLEAPKLFSTREAAEEELLTLENNDPDAYLDLSEQHGEKQVNQAYNNTSSLRVLWIDKDTLLGKLEDVDFLSLMVDNRLKLRSNFMEELRAQLEED